MRVKQRKNGAKNTSLFIDRGWGYKIGYNSLYSGRRASKLLFLERKLNSASNGTFFRGLRVFDLSQYFCVFFILRMSRRDFLLTQHFFLLYFFSRVIWPDSEAPVGKFRVLPFHRYIISCASWPETTRRGHDKDAYLIYCQKMGIFSNNVYGMG